MQVGAITGYMDVAQMVLYAFWIFFFCLVVYLRKQDRMEGYPLVEESLVHTGQINAVKAGNFPGAPLNPTGNPLLAGVGPGAWANRADVPDLTFGDRLPKIAPMRVASDFHVASNDPDPRGFDVIGGDLLTVGKVSDVWIDRSEMMIRYFEVQLAAGRRVLVPSPFVTVNRAARQLRVRSILASQFADVPGTKHPDQVTRLEEDIISAYFGAGTLFATPTKADAFF